MKEKYIVVSRTIDEEVKVVKVCDTVFDAMTYQLATLVGVAHEMAAPIVKSKPADIAAVTSNLEKYWRDRLANDEEEVWILKLPAQDRMR